MPLIIHLHEFLLLYKHGTDAFLPAGCTLTLPNLQVLPPRPATPPLLDLHSDNIYAEHTGREEEEEEEDDLSLDTPIYATTDEITSSDSVSNLTSAMSDTSSIYECDVRAREIHSQTLSSSYLIPITTFEEDEGAQQYDNLTNRGPARSQEGNLIEFW